jgi:CheY-like chemotaxis protein
MGGHQAPLILLVDDYEDGRAAFADLLSINGFRVATAETGREAVEKAIDLQPDLILMDMVLPDIDGCEATRIIRQDPRCDSIRIVAFTASGAIDAARSLRAGCEAVITKPCVTAVFLARIRALLETATP